MWYDESAHSFSGFCSHAAMIPNGQKNIPVCSGLIHTRKHMKRIKNDIENKTFARVYLLYGPESYLRLNYTKRLCDAIVPESDTMNRLDLEGDNVRESEIIDFAETIPFFAERRLVRIKDSGLMKTGAELLPDYMKSIPGHAVLVFCETEADMFTTVFVGSSQTRELEGRMVTPRGYRT